MIARLVCGGVPGPGGPDGVGFEGARLNYKAARHVCHYKTRDIVTILCEIQ
jgi:hypothetical protein